MQQTIHTEEWTTRRIAYALNIIYWTCFNRIEKRARSKHIIVVLIVLGLNGTAEPSKWVLNQCKAAGGTHHQAQSG
jgi:hypothetical protein